MAEATAWLLSFKGHLRAAVGELELVHVLTESPTLFAIPDTPGYCRHVLVWQGHLLPLVDLGARLEGDRHLQSDTVAGIDSLIAILAYQRSPGDPPEYGGLLLDRVPIRALVSDDRACALSPELEAWRSLAISCFEHGDHGPIPVLDVPRLFLSVPVSRGMHHAAADDPERVSPSP